MSELSNRTQSKLELLPKKLSELHPDISNALVIALVVNKTEPNIFTAKNDTQYRGVMNFTIRDSEQHIINCKVWDRQEKVLHYYENVKLGDIVDIICPKITLYQEKKDVKQPSYQPLATLPITLILTEGEGYLEKHSYHDLNSYSKIRQLWRLPHKPLHGVLNLADIKTSNNNIKTQSFFFDFLVMVGSVKPLREFKTPRDNKLKRCLEMVVFDKSSPGGVLLTIWQRDWIERALEFWKPLHTILHLIDFKVSYSDFYKSCTLSLTRRSLIYENPYGQETQALAQFASTMSKTDFEAVNQIQIETLPKPEDVCTIMTVKQIYDRIQGSLIDDKQQFTAVLYAMITKFNLDLPNFLINKRCKSCHRFIPKEKSACDSEKCLLEFSFGHSGDNYETFFNINVRLSDHTGTLIEAALTDSIASRLLGLNTTEFLKLKDEQLDKLKWSFLMDYFEVKVVIRKPSISRKKLMILVLDMRAIELDELSKIITVF
uniref:MEIOB-like N-terminal domain-containing protein n=1 Tax=Glossina austeni TaxID=7395 RepID=A0A1A9VG56_GLOAU